jgi:hypothetical protein
MHRIETPGDKDPGTGNTVGLAPNHARILPEGLVGKALGVKQNNIGCS